MMLEELTRLKVFDRSSNDLISKRTTATPN